MRIRKLAAAVVAGTALAGAAAIAAPAGASSQPPSIVAALAASAADNPAGSATDRNWSDFDILLAAASNLPFDAFDANSPTLAAALTGFTGTVFAPADASFRGLVADLTNTPIWKLSESDVLNTLLAIAGNPDLNGTGIPGKAALSETVRYHVTGQQLPNLRDAARAGTTVTTLTQLPALGLSDGKFKLRGPVFGLVGMNDDDPTDLDPFWFGQTIRTADGGTIHAIAGVLRPLDLKVLFPND
jgi:hypothetical protein